MLELGNGESQDNKINAAGVGNASPELLNGISGKVLSYPGRDKEVFDEIKNKISGESDQKELSRLTRLEKIHNMPDLTGISPHPINNIVKKILSAKIYEGFDKVFAPEVVSVRNTFDKFNFPENHVARRKSDTYYVDGEEFGKESLILRPHISVMRDSYLSDQNNIDRLKEKGELCALSWGKVYRVDDIDATHHQVFHQIDGLKITDKQKQLITKEDLKEVLVENVKAIFGNEVQYRIRDDHFPYTENSMEIDVLFNDERLEILGSGTVHPNVLKSFGLDPDQYNGWAFGIGVERIAMPLKQVPDIRIFWSHDERITKQRSTNTPFESVSKYPPTNRDFSIIVSRDYNEREITELMRDNGNELIEEVKKLEERDGNGKFGTDKKSVTYRIVFRSIDRTLTNDEINGIYFNIREKIQSELDLKLR